MARAQATTDHDVIRSWIETRKGHPSVVRATEGKKSGSAGLLRVDFGPAEDSLEEISWDDFFDTFDSSELAFLYQDVTAEGRKSRFHKFVSRDTIPEAEDGEDSGGSQAQSEGSKRSKSTRQASPQEEEEAEEIDEEDIEDLEDEDEDLDESDDDDDLDDDEIDEDEDEEEEEEVKPKRKR